jgi:outer membrane protein
MKRALIAAAAAFSFTSPLAQAADKNPWTVRVRTIFIDTANKSDAIPALAVPQDAIHVSTKAAPDIDIMYEFTDTIAAELLLTIPQKHSVKVMQSALGGPTNIGTFKHLPPTLLLQYRFLPGGTIRPYVGAGVNLTFIMNDDLTVPTVGDLKLDSTSIGPALQAGMDVKLNDRWSLSFDVKKVWINTDVKLGGTKVSKVDVDPFLYGVGVGYKF